METQDSSLYSTIFGSQGLSATVYVKLERETYFYIAIAIIVSIVVGGLIGGIAKDVVLKK